VPKVDEINLQYPVDLSGELRLVDVIDGTIPTIYLSANSLSGSNKMLSRPRTEDIASSADGPVKFSTESLILAQDERWRRA
jgi:hypothetical protein